LKDISGLAIASSWPGTATPLPAAAASTPWLGDDLTMSSHMHASQPTVHSETQANKLTPIANKRTRDDEVSICLVVFGTNLIDCEAYV